MTRPVWATPAWMESEIGRLNRGLSEVEKVIATVIPQTHDSQGRVLSLADRVGLLRQLYEEYKSDYERLRKQVRDCAKLKGGRR